MDGNKYRLVLQLTFLFLTCIPQSLEMLLSMPSDASFCQSTDCIHVVQPVQLKVMLYKSILKCISTKHIIYVFCVMKMAIRGIRHQQCSGIGQYVWRQRLLLPFARCNEIGWRQLYLLYIFLALGSGALLHFKELATRSSLCSATHRCHSLYVQVSGHIPCKFVYYKHLTHIHINILE